MPNYGLVINSKFRPFSYQEMLAPVAQATQAQQAIEDTYGQLQTKADEWKRIAVEEPNSKAAQMYNDYANSLEAAAEDLASHGLTPTSRQSLWDMTKRYSSEINPIAEAFKRKQLLSEEQRKAGNSMIYDMDAATTSIDRFIENPTLQYQSIDRKDLLNRSMAEFGSLAKSLEAYGKGQPIDNYTNTFIQQHGITRKAASDFVESVRNGNISSADPTLRAIYNNLYNSTGVSGWNSPTAQNAVKNTILEGVAAGIGQTNVSTFQDVGKIKALEHSYAMKRMEKQAELDAEKAARAAEAANKKNKEEGAALLDPIDQYAAIQKTNRDKLLKSGYIVRTDNGRYVVTKNLQNDYQAWEDMKNKYNVTDKELRYLVAKARGFKGVREKDIENLTKEEQSALSKKLGMNGQELFYIGNELRDISDTRKNLDEYERMTAELSQHTGKDVPVYNTKDGKVVFPRQINDLWSQELTGDLNRQVAYRYRIDESDAKSVQNSLISDLPNNMKGFSIVSPHSENGHVVYKKTGTLKRSDFSDYTPINYEVSYADKNNVNLIVTLKDENNEEITIEMPTSRSTARLISNLSDINSYYENENNKDISDELRAYRRSMWQTGDFKDIMSAEANLSSIIADSYRTNKSTEQKL